VVAEAVVVVVVVVAEEEVVAEAAEAEGVASPVNSVRRWSIQPVPNSALLVRERRISKTELSAAILRLMHAGALLHSQM
jgi:hypothetical protein